MRKAGNQVRITAQLIDARSDTHLWSQTYDRPLDDIFAVQDEIAAAVVEQLKVTLLGAAPKAKTTDPEAYALYLQARQLGPQRTAEAFEQSIALYRRRSRSIRATRRRGSGWPQLHRTRSTAACARSRRDSGWPARPWTRRLRSIRTIAPAHARLGWIAMYGRQRPRRGGAALRARAGARSGQHRHHRVAPRRWPEPRPPGQGDRARRIRDRRDPVNAIGAMQPGHLLLARRPARRGDRELPHRAEPEPGLWRRALPARRGAAAEGRCAGALAEIEQETTRAGA